MSHLFYKLFVRSIFMFTFATAKKKARFVGNE